MQVKRRLKTVFLSYGADARLLLKPSRVLAVAMDAGSWFNSLMVEGKKEWRYTSVLQKGGMYFWVVPRVVMLEVMGERNVWSGMSTRLNVTRYSMMSFALERRCSRVCQPSD